jgi:bla regulator protein BlaR1
MTPDMELLVTHLWQSTLVAGGLGLLICMLRANRAEVRYWIWLAASMKFLVPFAALVWIGNHIGWSGPNSLSQSDVVAAVQFVAQPFASTDLATAGASQSPARPGIETVLRTLVALWLIGVAGVLGTWLHHWRQVRHTVRTSRIAQTGRETQLLRRLEVVVAIKRPVPLMLSSASREPGLFGLRRPILLWPENLSAHLNDEHIEAILAHELSHLRRYDNVTAAMHMLVQVVFWFYPVVWWLGRRLVAERELACDEAVIRGGSDRRVYAESILKTCEQCLEPALPCVAGVGRSDLRERIEVIMNEQSPHPLPRWKRIGLAAAAFALIALPVALGSAPAAQVRLQSEVPVNLEYGPAFESASLRLNTSGLARAQGLGFPPEGRFFAENVSLRELIQAVYGREFLAADRLVGGADWTQTQRFDVYAKAAWDPGPGQRGLMVRTLLRQRFKLALHVEHREVRAYALTVAAGKPGATRLRPSSAVCPEGAPPPPPPPGVSPFAALCGVQRNPGGLKGEGARMWQFALVLGNRLGRTVVDRTGLQGRFDFTVDWAEASARGRDLTEQSMNRQAAILQALREQLGLDAKPAIASIPILVIDSAERPDPDR